MFAVEFGAGAEPVPFGGDPARTVVHPDRYAGHRVPVLADDTPESLAARVFAAECVALPEAIARFAAAGPP